MKVSKICTFLIQEAAQQLEHPMINTSVKLRKFLKQYGIVVNNTPDPVQVAKGRFAIEFRRTNAFGFSEKLLSGSRLASRNTVYPIG